MRIRAIIAVLLFACCSACSSSWHLRQAEKHIRRAQIAGAKVSVDTLYVKDTVFVNSIRVDSIFTAKAGDTVVIRKDKLTVKYVRLAGDSVYVYGECEADTVIRELKIPCKQIEAKGLDWKWLIVAFVLGAIVLSFIRR